MKLKRWLWSFPLWWIVGIVSCISLEEIPPSSQKQSLLSRVKHPDQLEFPTLEITIPKPQRHVLNNQLIVYLLEDHQLPLVEIIVYIRTGSKYDPKDKLGLCYLTATLLRYGGAGKLSPEEFDEELESMGAVLNVKTDYEEIKFSLSVLANDLPKGLQLLSDMLRTPRFSEEKLQLKKVQLAEIFRRENDNPNQLARREFRKLIYADHPYSNRVIGNPNTVASITREDLISFYQHYIKPNNLFLGLAGAFQTAEALELIKKTFEDWTPEPVDFPTLPVLERNPQKSVNLIPRKISQASIVLGHLGITRTSPDYFSIVVMNAILQRALSRKVRVAEGLTYSISSTFTVSKELGMYIIHTFTKTESVGDILELIHQEVKKIREEPVEDEDLNHIKEGILNRFVFNFVNSKDIIDQTIEIEFMGLPFDYFQTYRDKIMAVTKENILQVAKHYLNPDAFTYVVVGDEKKLLPILTNFGTVNIINLKEE